MTGWPALVRPCRACRFRPRRTLRAGGPGAWGAAARGIVAPAPSGRTAGAVAPGAARRLGIAALAALLGQAQAAPLPVDQRPYAYTVLDENLRDVLLQFGANTKSRIAISDAVQGRVRGRRDAAPPEAFLEALGREFGFDWYYDGYILYISATSESVSRMVTLGGVPASSLQATLEALGIADPRFLLRAVPESFTVLVSGPPRYVELVEQAVQTLAKPPAAPSPPAPAAPSPEKTVTVFRGSVFQPGSQVMRFSGQ